MLNQMASILEWRLSVQKYLALGSEIYERAMKWSKLGLVFCPSGETEWMLSLVAVFFAESVGGDLFKIYFSSRDKSNRSFTGYVVIDINYPNQILELSTAPVLSPGELGEFDDSGAMATWLTRQGDQKYLYYIGWNLGVTVPFRNSLGLANSTPGESFERYSSGPIIDRSVREPQFCASFCVIP